MYNAGVLNRRKFLLERFWHVRRYFIPVGNLMVTPWGNATFMVLQPVTVKLYFSLILICSETSCQCLQQAGECFVVWSPLIVLKDIDISYLHWRLYMNWLCELTQWKHRKLFWSSFLHKTNGIWSHFWMGKLVCGNSRKGGIEWRSLRMSAMTYFCLQLYCVLRISYASILVGCFLKFVALCWTLAERDCRRKNV